MFRAVRSVISKDPLKPLRRDAIRLPLQTVCAVALAYFAGRLFQADEVSWAVFSAIFVVQASSAGTWGSALDRIVGAFIGALLGCVLIYLSARLELPIIAAMISGVAFMSVVTAWRPQWSYGLVTVAILTVAPDVEMVGDILEKVTAVAIGSLCAAVTGSLVLPESTRRRARQDMQATAEALILWLQASTAALLNDDRGENHLHHERMDAALADAQKILWEAPRWWDRKRARPAMLKCRDDILKLRYSLAILDRLGWTPIPEAVRESMTEPLRALSNQAERVLRSIAGQSFTEPATQELPDLQKELDHLRHTIDDAINGPVQDTRAREHLAALAWAWATLARQLGRAAADPCASEKN